jgi:hypothetical protein
LFLLAGHVYSLMLLAGCLQLCWCWNAAVLCAAAGALLFVRRGVPAMFTRVLQHALIQPCRLPFNCCTGLLQRVHARSCAWL